MALYLGCSHIKGSMDVEPKAQGASERTLYFLLIQRVENIGHGVEHFERIGILELDVPTTTEQFDELRKDVETMFKDRHPAVDGVYCKGSTIFLV